MSLAMKQIESEISESRYNAWSYVRSPRHTLSSLQEKMSLLAQNAQAWMETKFVREGQEFFDLSVEIEIHQGPKLDEVIRHLSALSQKMSSMLAQNLELLTKMDQMSQSASSGENPNLREGPENSTKQRMTEATALSLNALALPPTMSDQALRR